MRRRLRIVASAPTCPCWIRQLMTPPVLRSLRQLFGEEQPNGFICGEGDTLTWHALQNAQPWTRQTVGLVEPSSRGSLLGPPSPLRPGTVKPCAYTRALSRLASPRLDATLACGRQIQIDMASLDDLEHVGTDQTHKRPGWREHPQTAASIALEDVGACSWPERACRSSQSTRQTTTTPPTTISAGQEPDTLPFHAYRTPYNIGTNLVGQTDYAVSGEHASTQARRQAERIQAPDTTFTLAGNCKTRPRKHGSVSSML